MGNTFVAERMQMVWSTLPKQLSKENKKFIYGLVREGARDFKGALTEQYVAGELITHGLPLYYYSTPNSTCEIDFILQNHSDIMPIEVKAEDNLKAKSFLLTPP